MTGSSRSRPVVELALWAGCEVTLARSGHYRVTYRGRFVGTIGASPSDHGAALNAKTFIRRNINRLKKEKAWQAR